MDTLILKTKSSQIPVRRAKSHYAASTDAELVVASQRGDKAALEQLLARHQRTIRGIIYQLSPRWPDAADLSQDVCIRVIQSIHQLKNPHVFVTWLRHIVRNLLYDELRKQASGARLVSLDQPLRVDYSSSEVLMRELADTAPVPEDSIVYTELSEKIGDAIASLPESFRKVVLFRDVIGLRYDEIATITHAGIGTVKSRIARGRAKLQVRLARYLRECA